MKTAQFWRFAALVAVMGLMVAALSMTGCDNGSTGSADLTPTAADFNISGVDTEYEAGDTISVSITPKANKSNGAITIYYTGIDGTTYPKSTNKPTAIGKYAVTFDVAAVTGWKAASGLSAGTLTMSAANPNTVARPTATPPEGEVASGATVTLSSTTAGAEIWYTTNGSAPSKGGAGSTKYASPIVITADITIKAIAVKEGMSGSEILTAAYTILAANTVARPAATPPAGAVASGATVTLSTTTEGAEIWYTTDGNTPEKDGAGSTKYASPITVTEAVTIKAVAVKEGMSDSGILEAAYTILAANTVARPAATPPAGAVASGATVTLSTATTGAEIWYTTDGNTPEKDGATSAKYVSPIVITADVTIKAIAVKDDMTDSNILTAAYTIDTGAPCTQITYNGNGSTGGEVPIDSNSPYQNGATVTVLGNTGNLTKIGNAFTGWNTAADGSGTPYTAGDTFSIDANTTLYAEWTPTGSVQYTVTYNGNGSTGGEVPIDNDSPYQNGATVTVLGNTGNLTKTDKFFFGWNTAANGNGTRYMPGATFTINNNTALYAQWGEWEQPPAASPLSANVWVDGSLAEETEQWFVFTGAAAKHYIHLNFTGLGYANVQVYTDLGVAIGNNQRLSSGYGNPSSSAVDYLYREIEVGQEYYIRVQQAGDGTYYKGAYRIALTETGESPNMITLPTENVVSLAANTWADGETDSGKDQWYSFIASSNTQYIHILPGTGTAFRMQVYGGNGGTIGRHFYSPGTSAVSLPELETGKTYYIKFTDYWGTFQMAFNDSTTPPPIALPTGDATTLTADTWADGTTNGGEWYSFTANADAQYIHFNFTTATGASVKVYDSAGNVVPPQKSAPVGTPSFSLELTNGSEYYLHVTMGSYAGAFQITFSAAETPPAITLPDENIIELTANTWITASTGYQEKKWFCFTANANPQYVHVSGISISLSFRLYDNNGNSVGNPTELGNWNNKLFLSWPVTSGQVYYIKAEGDGSPENNYQITFNDSETPPEL